MSALRALRPALRSVRAAQVARVAVAARPVAMRAFHVSFPARGSGESEFRAASAAPPEATRLLSARTMSSPIACSAFPHRCSRCNLRLRSVSFSLSGVAKVRISRRWTEQCAGRLSEYSFARSSTANITGDAELAAALASEHAYETEAASEEKPAFLKELLNEGVWSLADEPANDDVVLSRKFGDET